MVDVKIKSYMIHAHGSHDDAGTCLVPKNCMVYMLEDRNTFTYDEGFVNNIWHFSLLEIHDQLARGQNMGNALMDYVTGLDEINEHMGNAMNWFVPGQVVNNVAFSYQDKSFWSGCFELPIAGCVADKKLVEEVRGLDPSEDGFHERMDEMVNPGRGRLEFELNAEGWDKVYSKPQTLRALLDTVSRDAHNEDYMNIVFVMTCRSRVQCRSAELDMKGLVARGWDAKQLITDVCMNMIDYATVDHSLVAGEADDLSYAMRRTMLHQQHQQHQQHQHVPEPARKRLRVF